MTTIDELLKELSINHPLEQTLRPVIDAAMTARATQMAKKQPPQQFGAYGWIKGNGNIVTASINAHADNALSVVICEWAKINPGPLEAALDKNLHHLIPRNPHRRSEIKAKYQQYFQTVPIVPVSIMPVPVSIGSIDSIETMIETVPVSVPVPIVNTIETDPIETAIETIVPVPIVKKRRYRGKGKRTPIGPKTNEKDLLARIADLESQLQSQLQLGQSEQGLSWAEMCDD